MISTSSRLHRTMKGVKRFEMEVSDSTLKEFGISPLLSGGEHVLGLYRGEVLDTSFVVTDQAVILAMHGKPNRIIYDQMESSLIEVDEKSEANEINIKLKNGGVAKVVVDGGDGKFRDVFSFGRFIARVIEDRSQKSAEN